MVALIPTEAEDPAQLSDALIRALDGGPALGLGMLGMPAVEVAEGTAAVIATSGSSGVPKRVILSAAALRASAAATAARIGEGRWLLALPASYVAGLQVLVRSLLAGAAPTALPGRFTPEAFVEATSTLGASSLYTALVPAQLATLLDAASEDRAVLSALRAYDAILIGGQALPTPLRERAAGLGIRLVRTYGSTETSGGCVYDGVPLDGVEVRAFAGELRVSGPTLADGYLGDDALTARTFVRESNGIRWYRTGDLGMVQGETVQVHGRADNVIVSGGINISLDRVERIVREVPGLSQAVVVGVDDERWGEASVIVAPPTPQHAHGELLDNARAAVAAALGKHARPSRVMLVDEIPTLPSGKPDRDGVRRLVSG